MVKLTTRPTADNTENEVVLNFDETNGQAVTLHEFMFLVVDQFPGAVRLKDLVLEVHGNIRPGAHIIVRKVKRKVAT